MKINEIKVEIGNIKAIHLRTFYTEILEKSANLNLIEDKEDEKLCLNLIKGIKNKEIEEELHIKVVGFIVAHLSSTNQVFVDRGCFLATAFFNKDDFDAKIKASYNVFEPYLLDIIKKEKNIVEKSKYRIIENKVVIQKEYDTPETLIYDPYHNPLYIQHAIRILKENKDNEKVKSVHYHFQNILKRTTKSTMKMYENEIFELLCDLTNEKFYEMQFRNLGFFISENIDFFEKALKIFKETNLETKLVYLLFTFNFLVDLVDFEKKIKIHMKFAQVIMDENINFEGIVKEHVILFVESGMKLLALCDI